MSENSDEFLLQEMVNDVFSDDVVLNYIVVAEVMSSDSRSLRISTSEGMTTWLASGMLNCASDIILNQHYETEIEDFNDDN